MKHLDFSDQHSTRWIFFSKEVPSSSSDPKESEKNKKTPEEIQNNQKKRIENVHTARQKEALSESQPPIDVTKSYEEIQRQKEALTKSSNSVYFVSADLLDSSKGMTQSAYEELRRTLEAAYSPDRRVIHIDPNPDTGHVDLEVELQPGENEYYVRIMPDGHSEKVFVEANAKSPIYDFADGEAEEVLEEFDEFYLV